MEGVAEPVVLLRLMCSAGGEMGTRYYVWNWPPLLSRKALGSGTINSIVVGDNSLFPFGLHSDSREDTNGI